MMTSDSTNPALGGKLILVLTGVFVLSLAATAALASAPGGVRGTVTTETGSPLYLANVVLLGTPMGTTTATDGSFRLAKVPPGNYVLSVTYIGYAAAKREIQIHSGRELAFDFRLAEAVTGVMPKILVEGRQAGPDKSPKTGYERNKDFFDLVIADEVEDALQSLPGVIEYDGKIRIRGAREQPKYTIDDLPATDPMNGRSASLATVSVAQTEALVGGLDAEYGDAQAGVINIITPEGGESFSGTVEYMTDDYGSPQKTFNNYDRLSLGFGGPTPWKKLKYYASIQGTWSDTYLKTDEVRPRRQVLDFIRVGPRQSNELQMQSKLTWKAAKTVKATFEVLDSRRSWDEYQHAFSRVGYVQTRIDTIYDTGAIVTRYGDFSEEQEGPDWVYYNGPEHTPNFTDHYLQTKAVMTHEINPDGFYTLKLSRTGFEHSARVQDKPPWEYADGNNWSDRIHGTTHPYYATNGDLPAYSEHETVLWTFKGDMTQAHGGHVWKTGVEVKYNRFQNLNLLIPYRFNADGSYGLARSEYLVYNTEGSVYAQDRWEYEGMILNAGLRYDAFSVGNQLDASVVENRVKGEWSPRVGIAYPVTDNDVLSFHYGRFSQIPNREHIFQNRSSLVPVRGNPNIENQTTVSYQAALQHMFGEKLFGQFTVYFKDIFGLISTQQIKAGDNPNLVNQFVNQDYASSRGFEVSLTQRFTGSFSGEIAYTYGVATGLASDPNVQQQVDFLYLPISEQPLNWDRRHSLTASINVARPGRWSLRAVWRYGSGFPYSPHRRDERKFDPMLTNSKRLPGTSTLDVQAEKQYRVWGQLVTLFVRGNNILDTRNISRLGSLDWPAPPGTIGNDYEIFYAETGRAGGAYLGDDVNEDGIRDWVPLNDPRVWSEGRNIRVGVSIEL